MPFRCLQHHPLFPLFFQKKIIITILKRSTFTFCILLVPYDHATLSTVCLSPLIVATTSTVSTFTQPFCLKPQIIATWVSQFPSNNFCVHALLQTISSPPTKLHLSPACSPILPSVHLLPPFFTLAAASQNLKFLHKNFSFCKFQSTRTDMQPYNLFQNQNLL